MIIKECFITNNGISCIITKSNILDFNKYIHGYFLIRILEIVLNDVFNNKKEFKLLNFNNTFIDF